MELPRLLKERGLVGRVVSIDHLDDLRKNIESEHEQGLLDAEFYQEHLTRFTFTPPESMPKPRSVIVAAVAQPQIRFTFNWQGKRVPVLVPPTYLHARERNEEVRKALAEILQQEGYRVVETLLPKKLLAVCAGLAAYGKNNIGYIEGMGSFCRIVSFYSDLPPEEDVWLTPKMMERCEHCDACLLSCPSRAISKERFLLYAERCIVFHNEKPRGVPFPDWIDSSWHNCLVGCMHCQTICPENKNLLRPVEEGAEFQADETALLLAGASLDRLPAELVGKLEKSDLTSVLDVMPRNLRALLDRGR